MSCITETNHVVPFRQPVDVVRGVMQRLKAHLTVSVADATGQYEELLELEIEVTREQLQRLLMGGAK